jgi:glycerol-3-phosphate dehydrogenase
LTPQQQEAGRYAALARQPFDLLIIGGGIIGCGIARDAALRGLRVALFEKDDFSGGTSSRSTRLIHGGLRYLEQFDFGLVRQDLRERERLLATAPHRVVPLRFLVPLYRRSLLYRARLRVGMILYDLLSYDKSLPGHRFLSREETLREEPGLAAEGLQGAATYYDAQCAFVERLCLDNLTDAAENGALVYNDTRVTGLLRDGNRVRGLTLCDTRTAETAEVHAPQVVNASGPWLDALTGDLTGQASRRLRLTKGVHFAAPPASHNALVLFSATDGRLFFVIPWLDGSWVGTTDTDYTGDPDAVRATGEDVRYLREGVEPVLPCTDWERIYYTSAGLRALVRPTHANARESEVSRKHRLLVHTAEEGWEGLFSVLGGKITAYRGIAEETVNAIVRQHNARTTEIQNLNSEIQNPKSKIQNGGPTLPLRPCMTATRPLPGGDFADREALRSEIRREATTLDLGAAQADNLTTLYGTRAGRLLELARRRPELRAPIAPPYPDIVAEIAYAVEQEWARTVSDFLLRRSLLGFTPDQGQAALPAVAAEMGRLLDWTPERSAQECDAYRAHVALTQAFRQD